MSNLTSENYILIDAIKMISMLIMFLMIIITGSLPFRWFYLTSIIIFYKDRKKFQNSIKLLSFANAFSGGLFLSVAVIHLLPEVILENLTKS